MNTVALVRFRLPTPMSMEQARRAFESSAPKYLSVKGLIRKYFLRSGDGLEAGGVYLWRSREDAESFFGEEWARFIAEKYGSPPSVTLFDSPVIVDNLTKAIVVGD